MKILIDTNIFLDIILKREKHYENSAKIWTYISDKKIIGHISAISINNLYYILKRKIELKLVNEIIDQILEEFKVISLTKEILKHARIIDNKDYEDSIQFISAVNSGCEYIVTRNKKDFPENGIKIVSPGDFINIIMKMGTGPAIC